MTDLASPANPTKRATRIVRSPGGRAELLARTSAPHLGLGQVPDRLAPEATASMVCGYCSTGCSLDVHLRDGVAVNITPSRAYPVNRGSACPKGWEALTPMEADDRASMPLLHGQPVSWPVAARTFVDGFRAIIDEHGPGAVAYLSTGQITTEEMALLGVVAKVGMGFLHGDGNTRQCMATSVVAHKTAFGFDAPPYTYADFEETDLAILFGSNLCVAHPILWERLARNSRGARVVVVDPRRTETAAAADQHVRVGPKGDLALLLGIGHVLVRDDLCDATFIEASTTGFEAWAEHVTAWTPDRAAAASGVPAADIVALARQIGTTERVSLWWTMGVNQGHQAVRTAEAIIDIALATGNIGRPGTGANSITGQCNAMGSRAFSGTASLFGGRAFGDAQHRAEVAAVLGCDVERIPSTDSLAYDQIIDGVRAGRIKGLWVIATNGAHSWIAKQGLADALDRLDLLVVQDLYADTDTARVADLVLPAAGWGEKDGTFINSERRVGLIKKVRQAPGQALSDLSILRLLATAWGCADLVTRWATPEDSFAMLQRLSAGRACDLTGIKGYDALERLGGVQWPLANGDDEPAPMAERRLYEDGRSFHADGRFRFASPEDPAPLPDPTTRVLPLTLITGRSTTAEWHTQTRTGRSAVLRRLAAPLGPAGEPMIDVHPEDAAPRSLVEGSPVRVVSRHGSIDAVVHITHDVGVRQAFLPMHHAATNLLTPPVVDPRSRQPAYKATAVDIVAR